MNSCTHANIMLIPKSADRLRCRFCHLTLKAEELSNGYCPECLAVSGRKRADFEKVESEKEVVQYRCEECGALIGGDS